MFYSYIQSNFDLKLSSMKQLFLIPAAVLMLAACGGNDTKTKEAPAQEPPTTTSVSDNPDYQKGLELIAKNDCLTCHKVEEKNIGPAYRDVAAKYENTEANVKHLAEKVIKGGTGVWGEVPMTPHPQLSQSDAEQIVKYILLLKK